MGIWQNEKRLVKKILKGDKQALHKLYEENFEALYSFIYYRVGCDKHITEDITHDVFMSMLDNLKDFNSNKGSLHSWICGIARHKIMDLFRSNGKFGPIGIAFLSADKEIDSLLEVIDNSPLPDEVLENKELKACVACTISKLPITYRYVLTSKYIDNFQIKEIADRMKLSEKAVESLLTRAREAFRKIFSLMLKDNVLMENYGGGKI